MYFFLIFRRAEVDGNLYERVGPNGRTSGIGWGQKDGPGQKTGAKTVGPNVMDSSI